MDSESTVAALGALAQNTRLAIVDLLAKAGPKGMPAGDIATRLGVPRNTMSAHLSVLKGGGLVIAERNSRSIFYSADPAKLWELTQHLGSLAKAMSATDSPDP